MTPEQYATFARLFDAAVASYDVDQSHVTVQLSGSVAGAALRYWATQRRVEVTPEVLSEPTLGSWTALRAHVGYSHVITVHLRDFLVVPSAEAA